MAVIKQPTPVCAKAVAKPSLLKKRKNVDEELDFELPTEVSEPATSIGDYTFL